MGQCAGRSLLLAGACCTKCAADAAYCSMDGCRCQRIV